MGARISLDRETVDRMILIGMDVDRYQTQVIPDLQKRVGGLTEALQALVRAVRDAGRDPARAPRLAAQASSAERVLEADIALSKEGRL